MKRTIIKCLHHNQTRFYTVIYWFLSDDYCSYHKLQPYVLLFTVVFSHPYYQHIFYVSQHCLFRHCGCLCLPCTILQSGHMSFTSLMTLAVNSLPLSDWRICGAPISRNISSSWNPTSKARFDVRAHTFL